MIRLATTVMLAAAVATVCITIAVLLTTPVLSHAIRYVLGSV